MRRWWGAGGGGKMVGKGGRGRGVRGRSNGGVRRGRRWGRLGRCGRGAGSAFGLCPLFFTGRTVLVEVQGSKCFSYSRCNNRGWRERRRRWGRWRQSSVVTCMVVFVRTYRRQRAPLCEARAPQTGGSVQSLRRGRGGLFGGGVCRVRRGGRRHAV